MKKDDRRQCAESNGRQNQDFRNKRLEIGDKRLEISDWK
jgi:hypothetical protein